MDQALKRAEDYRRKAKLFSRSAMIVFVLTFGVPLVLIFVPLLMLIALAYVPFGVLLLLVLESVAVAYRFRARKVIRSVITVPDPSLKKEQTEDTIRIALLLVIVVIVAIVIFKTVGSSL